MATWTLVDEDAVGFHDGSAGHVYTIPAGAPTANDWDVIFLNSNTVLTATPTGWTRALDLIANYGAGNQGAYTLVRKALGSEGATVTIQTSGNFNTALSWSRHRGGDALDVATAAVIDASAGSVTPPVSTGTLADPDELVLACAALQGSFPTVTPSWSTGYTPLTGVQYNGGSVDEVSAYVAYRTDGGTAAETPQADWTSTPAAPVPDRYVMVVTFTPAAGVDARSGTGTISATATLTSTGTAGRAGTASTSATATLASSGMAGRAGTGSVSASATLSSAGAAGRRGSGQISATAALTSSGAASRAGTGLLAVAAALTGSGFKSASGTGSITVAAILTSGGPRGPGTLTPSTTGSTLTASTRASSTLTITRTP